MRAHFQLIVLVLASLVSSMPWAQATDLTYQGRLQQSGEPFSGTANLQFFLFDAASGGSQIGPVQTRTGWPVSKGLFQVDLDFGDSAFDGSNRFLEVWVNGAPLSPRQSVRAAPVALYALDGNQGPPGPAGSRGPEGPEGPRGPAGQQGPAGSSPFQLGASGSFSYEFNNSLFSFTPRGTLTDIYGPSVVIGRASNQATGAGAVVLGGGYENAVLNAQNVASGINSIVAGGDRNTASGVRSGIFSGQDNCAGANNSLALGVGAKIRPSQGVSVLGEGCDGVPSTQVGDRGTFVWSDATGGLSSDYVSSGPDQFLVRARGGAVFTGSNSVNDPAGNRVRIDGRLRVDSLGSSGEIGLCRNSSNQISGCSSSARYKQAIEDLDIELDVLMQLRPVRYQWITSGNDDVGLVAEEVAEIFPVLATYNDDGSVEGVKYDRLAAVLVGVVQHQQVHLELLQEQIDEQALAEERHQQKTDQLHALLLEVSSRLSALEGTGPSVLAGEGE